MEKVREEFYNFLQQNMTQTANSDIKIILEDFNVKGGKGGTYEPTFGNESLHKETNKNEIKMI